MNKQKLNKYNLTGSFHTLEIKSDGMLEEPMREVSTCITATTQQKNGLVTKSIINPNKLVGDVFSYKEFETVFSTILAGAGIDSYNIVRADLRLDSYDDAHYKDFSKLNRYLISALAVTYKIRNSYRTTNLFSQEQLSIAVKNRRFEAENYDKQAESNGTDLATSRLEIRTKDFQDNDLKREFVEKWFLRWDKALKNLDKVQERYNTELVRIYQEGQNAYPCRFLSLREFLMQYQDCIFSKKQMINLLKMIGQTQNPENYVKNYKQRYGIEFFSQKDVEKAISEIKRATLEFFNT